MKPGQNPLVALTHLEEIAAQLVQQDFAMAPNQPLIQFLSILPDSEYEVEKRTFSNGQQLEREQVLLAIRTRYQNLQRQRRRNGGRRDGGHAFMADERGDGKFGGSRNFKSDARRRGRGAGRGRGRGGRQ